MHDAPAPILDMAMKFLREEEDRFVWVENGREALETLIDLIFVMDTDPIPQLDEMLRLAAALETSLRSPEAAAVLMSVLGTDPRVQATFSREASHEKRELAAKWAGSNEVKAVPPMYGATAPAGSITAGTLLEGRRLRHLP